MKTTVTRRGQTVVPAPLRRRYQLGAGAALEWIDSGEGIRVVPLPKDVIAALRGAATGERLSEGLRRDRLGDRKREGRR